MADPKGYWISHKCKGERSHFLSNIAGMALAINTLWRVQFVRMTKLTLSKENYNKYIHHILSLSLEKHSESSGAGRKQPHVELLLQPPGFWIPLQRSKLPNTLQESTSTKARLCPSLSAAPGALRVAAGTLLSTSPQQASGPSNRLEKPEGQPTLQCWAFLETQTAFERYMGLSSRPENHL